MSGKRIVEAAKEALAIARGLKKPAAVWVFDPAIGRMVRVKETGV